MLNSRPNYSCADDIRNETAFLRFVLRDIIDMEMMNEIRTKRATIRQD